MFVRHESGRDLWPRCRQVFDGSDFVTTKQKGMGPGLPICRTIVESHGGKIWVDDSPTGGTIFRFSLRAPLDDPEEMTLAP